MGITIHYTFEKRSKPDRFEAWFRALRAEIVEKFSPDVNEISPIWHYHQEKVPKYRDFSSRERWNAFCAGLYPEDPQWASWVLGFADNAHKKWRHWKKRVTRREKYYFTPTFFEKKCPDYREYCGHKGPETDEVWAFSIAVMNGCEPFNILFCTREGTEGASIKCYKGSSFTKTEYAEFPAVAHLTVIRILDFLATRAKITVSDEADYWETRNEDKLIKNFESSKEGLAALSQLLHRITRGTEIEVECPIDGREEPLDALTETSGD